MHLACIEALLEHTPADEQIEAFNAATHQLLGDFAARYECSSASDLERKRLNILTDAHGIQGGDIRPTFECSKAAQNAVDISTDIGTTQMRVPANKRTTNESWRLHQNATSGSPQIARHSQQSS